MANLTKDKVLAALPTLTKLDLKAIQAVIGTLLGSAPTDTESAPEAPLGWLYDALTLHLGAQQNYQAFLKTPPGKQFIKNGPVFLNFIQVNFKGVLDNKVRAQGLMRHLGSLLFEDMKRQKVPITRRTVMANLQRIGDVFRSSYPGYLESGLAVLVLKAITEKK